MNIDGMDVFAVRAHTRTSGLLFGKKHSSVD